MNTCLIESLQRPEAYKHATGDFQVFETHISWVILTGPYAYKLKKPIDFGFLDFSTLEKRKFFCEEEIRLNSRLAPKLYLDVVPICGTANEPNLKGEGEIIEYAVRMHPFVQEDLLSHLAENNRLTQEMVDDMGNIIAQFHNNVDVAGEDTPFGSVEMARKPVLDNFGVIEPILRDADDIAQLNRLKIWEQAEFARIKPLLAKRKSGGFVRECHGDIHLGNIARVKGEITIFDCIEFNQPFRWIDVISEVAFLVMDLQRRGLEGFAFRFLNQYIERTGDYEGLGLLYYYLSYRAIVRAKIAMLRIQQCNHEGPEIEPMYKEYKTYIKLAEGYAQTRHPKLILMHGFSGSGKTTVSQRLLESLSAIRVRSDVERKRLYGLQAEECSRSTVSSDMYSKDATQKTFRILNEQASRLLSSGFSVIVDATFLKKDNRAPFIQYAEGHDIPYTIVDCHAPRETLEQWITERSTQQNDASEATLDVLHYQLEHHDPLDIHEQEHTCRINTANANQTSYNELLDDIVARFALEPLETS